MTNKAYALVAALLSALGLLFVSCEDDTSTIGSGLDRNELTIVVDSAFTVSGSSTAAIEPDPRSTEQLVGRINVPEFGNLQCSYMAQFMAAQALGIPDSIGVERVDSMKLMLRALRGNFTGDSVAPQQLSVYRLKKPLQLTAGVKLNPEEYVDRSAMMGKRTYTMTALGLNDSLFKKSRQLTVPISLPKEFARKVFTDYRTNPSVFQWPSTFAREYFPGIYVEPSFGRGCISNFSKSEMVLYYYRLVEVVDSVVEGVVHKHQIHLKDSVTLFSTAPEVISLNNISMTVSDALKARIAGGENIIVSPSGYNVRMTFPLREIIERYNKTNKDLTVIDNLTFSIPASKVENDFGIDVAPNLLMVKTKDLDKFFADNLVPDKKTSFWATYNSTDGSYNFDSMRQYLLDALENPDKLEDSDMDFTLVSVSLITQQKQTGYDKYETIVTGVTFYVTRPTMAQLHLDRAKVKFSYSIQTIN